MFAERAQFCLEGGGILLGTAGADDGDDGDDKNVENEKEDQEVDEGIVHDRLDSGDSIQIWAGPEPAGILHQITWDEGHKVVNGAWGRDYK